MHNKLTCQFALGLNKLRISKSLSTITKPEILTPPCKYQRYQTTTIPGFDRDNLINLLPNERRKLVTYGPVQFNMNETRKNTVNSENVFRMDDYDCVGFDLDNTICRYKLSEMIKLEYEILSQYLVNEKGHDPDYLYKPVEDNVDFIQKGLVLDFARGNVLQINSRGYVLKASHGTKFLSDNEITQVYGEDRCWTVAEEFTKNMLDAWNGPLSEKIRTLLDYFDMPASLVFARIVDSFDAKGGAQNVYNVWPDVLDGLIYMFRRENFVSNEGGYFPALKENPEKYINRCSDDVLNWLKQIKKDKVTFLITGSHVDFASLVASTSMGDNWRNLFDIVVCYARKPGFFTGGRPFLSVEGAIEDKPLKGEDLKVGYIYSQGNWQDLYGLLCRESRKKRPKCLYIGDNLIQDVYTPSEYTACDTVAVVEEMLAEGMSGCNKIHSDESFLVSKLWGSYFCSPVTSNTSQKGADYSIWADIIRKHSKLCVPTLEEMSRHPLNHSYPTFIADGNNKYKQLGYYPCPPVHLDARHE